MTPYTEPELNKLARVVRQAFIEAKTRGIRKIYNPSARHDKMEYFTKAASLVVELQADPYDFIKAAFIYCKIKGGPFANALGGPAARGWYISYCLSLGIQVPALKTPTDIQIAQANTPMYAITYACDIDFQMDIDIALSMFYHNTGTTDPNTPGNKKLLRDSMFSFPIVARAILGAGDVEVLTKFGQEIYDFFTLNPNYKAAAERCGQPIEQVLTWIRDNLINPRSRSN